MNPIRRIILLFVALSVFNGAKSQDVAIKTNLLADAFLNVNLGIEAGVAPRWTMEAVWEYNGWNVNNHRWRHWLVEPEARYWFCSRFTGHFIGLSVIGGEFNFGNIHNGLNFLGSDFSQLSNKRYQGWGIGGGFNYGYSWIIGRRLNIEAEIGIGYIYARYDEFECSECNKKTASNRHHGYFGPTKAAINLVYLF